ncbi:MAG: phosphatidylglycerophosphatase [Deltaproteobacteria bacterium]|nr:phosphatidylglycerophosphatase [Deltaproteobacteria bacterium]
MRLLVTILASAGCVGFIPVASGTFGTMVAVPLFWGFDAVRSTSVPLYLLTYVGMVAAACWIAGLAEHVFQEHDSHKIVIDEVVGYLAATLFLAPTWPHALAAFLVFRALDVFKPFPAGYIDKNLPGGYGVVLDDVVSGIYSNLVVQMLMAVGVLG